MLIRNRSEIERIIKLRLEYDDHSKKEGELKVGDIIGLSFRYDSRIRKEWGKVKKIYETFHYTMEQEKKASAAILFDASKKFGSKEFVIPIGDIIDFSHINPNDVLGPNRGKIPMKVLADLRED